MTGARFTRTGTPAAASVRTVRSRRCGLAARGSRMRASFGSSDVMLMLTDARSSCAIAATRSRSRSISDDLVTSPNGWRAAASTSRTPRVIFSSRSMGW